MATDGGDLAQWRRLAAQPNLGEQAAVNAWCGTTGASIIRALNAKQGRTDQATWRSIAACLREIAAKPNAGEGSALKNIV